MTNSLRKASLAGKRSRWEKVPRHPGMQRWPSRMRGPESQYRVHGERLLLPWRLSEKSGHLNGGLKT
jgi:hypothetical protein